MTRKLIFLDIDGTLTPPGSNTPPDSALAAIRAAQKNGHLVVLCSGRNRGMLAPLLAYGFDGIIASAGGYIELDGQVIFDCPMAADQQQRVMQAFADSGIFRTIETRDGSYTDEGFKTFLQQHCALNSEMLRWREQIEQDLGIRPMAEYDGAPAYKVVFMCPDKAALAAPMAALQAEFNFCLQDPDADTGVINGELINKNFNKGTAVHTLCAHLGIPLEDTIAFGDSMNDYEMIETAHLGICMENGSEALKQIADKVCPAVDKDGLAKAFAELGLV